MNETILLKQAAEEARQARKHGVESEDYLKAIEKMDKIVKAWKKREPKLFWNVKDPIYIKMSREWEEDRDRRFLIKNETVQGKI
jgi:hypothetical protein